MCIIYEYIYFLQFYDVLNKSDYIAHVIHSRCNESIMMSSISFLSFYYLFSTIFFLVFAIFVSFFHPFQVCIVQKRDSGRLFAMKYVSRGALDGRGALGGVLKEVELLSSLEHPFLVNLWFSFQGKRLKELIYASIFIFNFNPF